MLEGVSELQVVLLEADLFTAQPGGLEAFASAGRAGVKALEVGHVWFGLLVAVEEGGQLPVVVGAVGGGEGAACGPFIGVHVPRTGCEGKKSPASDMSRSGDKPFAMLFLRRIKPKVIEALGDSCTVLLRP